MMRARLLGILIAAVAGSLTMGVGVVGAQGLEGGEDAGVQQYGAPSQQRVLGEVGEVGNAPTAAAAPQAQAQPTQPQEAQEGELPFTGLATGGLVLLGVALLGGGFMLRRSVRENH